MMKAVRTVIASNGMRSVGSHSKSGGEMEGKKERTVFEVNPPIFSYTHYIHLIYISTVTTKIHFTEEHLRLFIFHGSCEVIGTL